MIYVNVQKMCSSFSVYYLKSNKFGRYTQELAPCRLMTVRWRPHGENQEVKDASKRDDA